MRFPLLLNRLDKLMRCILSKKKLKMKRSIVKLSGVVNAVTKVVAGCLSTIKVAIF